MKAINKLLKEKGKFIILLGIILLGFILRVYKLGDIPSGLYQDETAIGYNAYSILTTGKDEYGRNYPFYFQSFGDYKLPVYIYIVVPFIKLFGLTAISVRLPSALFGTLSIYLLYIFVRQWTKSNLLALMSAFLLSINPWHVHYSRAAFEVSIVLALFLLGVIFLYSFFTRLKRGAFFIGTFCFILAVYSYNLTRLLAPLLYIVTLLYFSYEFNNIVYKRRKNEIILTCLTAIVLLIPFVYTLFNPEGISSAKGTLIFSSARVKAPIIEFRSYFVYLPFSIAKLMFNTFFMIVWVYLKNIIRYFSVNFYFLTGSPHGNHGIGVIGQFYIFEFVTILYGIYHAVCKKRKWLIYLVLWFFLVVAVASLTREAPHATRSFFILVPFIIFSANGLLNFYRKGKNAMKGKGIWSKMFVFIAGGIVVYSIIFYVFAYFVWFPISYADKWRYADKQLSLYLRDHEYKYDKIIIDKNAGVIYTSLLFYLQYSPELFHQSQVRFPTDSEGFSMVRRFGKFEFAGKERVSAYKTEKVLFISKQDTVLDGFKEIKKIKYPKRPVVIAIGQKLFQYPIEETAYIVSEKL